MEGISQDVINSELLLFDPIRVNRGTQQIQWVEYRPVNQLSDNSPIEVCVPGTGSKYIDLKRSRLYVKACIKKGDLKDMDEKDYVAPCNLFLQSLFSQVDVYLQQKLVSSGAAGHPYRAMFDTLLNFGPPALESQFQSQLFYKDTGGAMDYASKEDTDINQGFVNRQMLTRLSQSVDMEGPVYADLMQMDRYLLNGCELRLKFHQSSNPFSYSGSYSLNPFNFHHFLCNFLSVSIDGMSVPGKPITPKFSKDKGQHYITAYQSLFAGLKNEDLDEGIYTNRLDYGQGYTIYIYD